MVDVDQDTGVSRGIELLTSGTRWGSGSATRDLQVDALRVILSAVCVCGGVKSNNFVAHNVVSRSDGIRDCHSPAVVGGDKFVGSPCTWSTGVVDQTTLVNLDKVQLSLVHSRAVAIAVGEVGDNGAVMAVRPWAPLELDSASCSNWSRNRSRCGVLVADNVWICILRRIDKSQVGCSGCPPNDSWWVGLVGELIHKVSRVTDSL